MPELPEVETVRRGLEKTLAGRRIVSLTIFDKKKIILPEKDLITKKVLAVERIGKLLALKLSNEKYLLAHLKMTGQLILQGKKDVFLGGHGQGEIYGKSTRAVISFSGGFKLLFNDQRRFGYLKVEDKNRWLDITRAYGPEPIASDFSLVNIWSRKKLIKAALLDQSLVAGVGNIYADEALYAAGIRAERQTNSLSILERKVLEKSLKTILKKAVLYNGTTFSDYLDSFGKKGNYSQFLKVYGRRGEKCFKCGNLISYNKVAGRGTSFCKFCQK